MASLINSSSNSPGEEILAIGESSYLQSAAYNPQALQMTVVFKTGQQHVYYQVFPNVWQAFKEAPSKGEYYAQAIRGKFGSVKTVDKTVGKPVAHHVKPTRSRLKFKQE